MVGRKYESWEEFFEDVELMCANAMAYNEDGSEVYQDASHIKVCPCLHALSSSMGTWSDRKCACESYDTLNPCTDNAQEILDYNRAEIKTRLTLPVAQQRQRLKPVATPNRGSQPLGTPGSSVAGNLPLPGDLRRQSGSPLPSGSGYYGSPLASSSNLHPHIPANPHAPASTFGTPGSNGGAGNLPYPTLSASQAHSSSSIDRPSAPSSAPAPQFRAPLPHGHVSEPIVASLPSYTEAERRAWVASLTQAQLGLYRQYATAVDARKRVGAGQPAPPLADPPSAARPTNSAGVPATALPLPMQTYSGKRTRPGVPGIKCFEFGFEGEKSEWEGMMDDADEEEGAGRGNGDVDMDSNAKSPTPASRASKGRTTPRSIRLHNLRGVGTHALLVGPSTTQLVISAYYSDFILSSLPSSSTEGSAGQSPQLTLKLNGSPVNGQTTILEPLKRLGPEDDRSSSVPAGSPAVANGTAPADEAQAAAATDGSAGSQAQKPRGMRWTVDISPQAMESTLHVVLVRPAVGQPGAGSITEVNTIYVARQF